MGIIKKREIIILLVAVFIFLFSLIFSFSYNAIKNSKPSVYYRTYTKEKGWSKWSKDGETSGNGYDITALQVKVKTRLKGNIYYNVKQNGKFKTKRATNRQVIGDKKSGIQEIKMNDNDELSEKYKIYYRISTNSKKWQTWGSNNLEYRYVTDSKTINIAKYIQMKMVVR